jgi:hypothetical protein
MEKLKPQAELPTPVRVIFENRAALSEEIGGADALYTPPAEKHYLHLYPWDSSAAAYILTHFGYLREAETELFSIFHRQRPNGMVPNIQRLGHYRKKDPELLTFTEPDTSSDYSQPPIWPMAIEALYQARKADDPDQAKLFLQEILPRAKESLGYFIDNRQLSNSNPLIFNVAPSETGRDGDPALNGYAPHLPRNGAETPQLVDLINSGVGYLGRIGLGSRNLSNGWDPQRTRRYYAAVDPMFNSIYARNLRLVGELASELEETNQAGYFHAKADAVEEAIIKDLFEPEAEGGNGAFLVDNVKGKKDIISITALGPLLLKNLPEDQLESVLNLMDSSFNTPYPLPTVAADSRYYDPEGRQPHHVWVSEVMTIANFLCASGLRAQAKRADLAHRRDLRARSLHWSDDRIVPRSRELIAQGYYEGYSPETGRPKRTGTVRNFVWNGLIETL